MDKKISIWWLVILVIVVIVATKVIDDKKSKKLEAEIQLLELERIRLQNVVKSKNDSIELYETRLNTQIGIVDSLKKAKESIKTKRNEIPTNVGNMPVSELDSILTDYVHPR